MKCSYASACPLLNLDACFRYPEYIDFSKKRGQGCLFAHVFKVLEIWGKLRIRYITQLKRILKKCLKLVLTESEVDELVKIMLILHDYGKAAKEYLNVSRGIRYLHEILSSVIIFDLLSNFNDTIAALLASTVLLHHEHRVYKILRYTGYRKLNDVVIREILRGISTINVEEKANQSFKVILRKNVKRINIDTSKFLTTYTRSELECVMNQIAEKVISRPMSSWIVVGALNHILIITDIRAAHSLRRDIKEEISRYFRVVLYGGRSYI